MKQIHSLIAACTLLASFALQAQDSEGPSDFLNSLNWTHGPAEGDIESIATIQIPEGFVFTGGDDTRRLMEAMGNPLSHTEVGLIAPPDLDWFVVFEFSEVGYVKDDDKDDLDANALLSSIKRGNREANDMRQQMGMAPLNIVGWEREPYYNEETNLLEWAVRAESEGRGIINFNTRILGRRGVMEVALVTDPESLNATLPQFRELMSGYNFSSGNTYAEYQSGDKVAKYGLAALVVGGAAVGAAKLGFFAWIAVMFKKLWKLLILAALAVVTWIRKLVGRKEPAQ